MQVLNCCHKVHFVSLGFACAGHYSLMHEALQKVPEQISPALILCALLAPIVLLFVISECSGSLHFSLTTAAYKVLV